MTEQQALQLLTNVVTQLSLKHADWTAVTQALTVLGDMVKRHTATV